MLLEEHFGRYREIWTLHDHVSMLALSWWSYVAGVPAMAAAAGMVEMTLNINDTPPMVRWLA